MKSKTQIHRFLLTPLLEKLKEQIALADGIDECFTLLPLYKDMMDHLFLRLTGILEQKITTFHWYFGLFEITLREEIKKNIQSQTIGRESLDKNYTLLNKFKNKLSIGNSCTSAGGLWDHDENLKQAHTGVVESFKSSIVIDYDYRAFNEFANNSTVTCKSWNLKDKRRYEQFINYRHQLAHNFLAPSAEMPDFRDYTSDDYKYTNHFYRYTLCIYIDYQFMDLYKNILDQHAGHFF